MDTISRFTDLGVPVPNCAENRSSVLTKDLNGNLYLIIFSEGFLLNVNLSEKKAHQRFFPENNNGYPFGSFVSRSGLVYSAAESMFMEYDPSKDQFTFFEALPDAHTAGWSFGEDASGRIFFGSYSAGTGGRLFSYDPLRKTVQGYGIMDPYGDYVDHLALDSYGWVYMGVGTFKKGIVAYHPETGEKKQLLKEEERTRGSCYIRQGIDGKVYGHFNLEDVGYGFKPEDAKEKWYLFEKGLAVPVPFESVAPDGYYNNAHTFQSIHSPFVDPSFIKEYDIGNHEILWEDLDTHEMHSLRLEYVTQGAHLSPIAKGPDGRIYGTSNHPMHAYCYDPETEKLLHYGGKFYEKSGGGNICAYAVQGSVLGGVAYYGGKIHIFDTSKPIRIDTEDPDQRNPKLVAEHEEILRPRCAAAHIDKESFLFGGFGPNGGTGGGLCIYNYKTKEDCVIPNEELLIYHSTLAIEVLPDGNPIAGTTIESPCGGKPNAQEAELYILDWKTRKVIFRCVPVPGQREISLMKLDDRALLHGITSGLVYFVFDPLKKKTIHTAQLKGFGHPVRDGLVKGEDGLLYGLCQKAIYVINTKTFAVEKLAEPPVPVSSGMAYLNGVIYFSGPSYVDDPNKQPGHSSHLWKYTV
jgi:hypothetical protein